MRAAILKPILVGGFLLLAACGDGGEGAGGVTAEESKQLNEAAAMLDASPEALPVADDADSGNDEAALPAADPAAGETQESQTGSANSAG